MRFLFIILLFPFVAQAQTRMYFSSTQAAPISTVTYDAAWVGGTSEASRWKLNNTKGSSAISAGTIIGPISGGSTLDRQYVSTRMNAGISFTSGSTTLTGQLMVREYANTDDVTFGITGVKIVSEDGLTVRATVWSYGDKKLSVEFINNASHRNKTLADGDAATASYTTVLGDRIVVEFGFNASGTTPEASAKWGENATDLPVDETQTTDGAGWIEFSNTITFAGEAGPTRRVTIIQ